MYALTALNGDITRNPTKCLSLSLKSKISYKGDAVLGKVWRGSKGSRNISRQSARNGGKIVSPASTTQA